MSGRVLLARQDSMGDVLLSGPAVRAVAAGAHHVTYLAGPRGTAAARMLPGVGAVLTRTAEWIDPCPGPVSANSVNEFVDLLAGLDLDEGIILTSFHQSALPLALLLRMAGIPRLGAISTDYPGSLLDVRHSVDDDVHEVDRSLSLVQHMGYRLPAGDGGELRVTGAPENLPRDLLPPDGLSGQGTYVVVHPGASVPARAWRPDRARSLVASLASKGTRVVVTGSAAERELCAYVSGVSGGATVCSVAGRCDLPVLAAVLRGASVVVCGNTGPAHLAAAVGTPVVSMFAPTVPACRWRPWRVPHVVLGDQQIACAGCRARTCPVEGHPCIGTVPVVAVVQAVQRLARERERAGLAGALP